MQKCKECEKECVKSMKSESFDLKTLSFTTTFKLHNQQLCSYHMSKKVHRFARRVSALLDAEGMG